MPIASNFQTSEKAKFASKQDKLTGVNGQVVGFDKNGNAVAQDAPDICVTSFNGCKGDVNISYSDVNAAPADAGIKIGGTSDQIMVKKSDADYDVEWRSLPKQLPAGGTAGQILSKASAEDQDVEWKDPPEGVGRSMAGKTVEPTQGTTVTASAGAEIFNDYRTRAYGTDSGYETIVPTAGNIASGRNAHAEGNQTTATGSGSHAEGNGTTASGVCAHAEGGRYTGDVGCIASGYGSHAEGVSTKSSGSGSHSEGRGTKAEQNGAHAEGISTTAGATCAHAEGSTTQATGNNSHAEGWAGIAEGSASHVEGGQVTDKAVNKASGYAAHAEGASTLASGGQSHAEGEQTTASGNDSHSEGYLTKATAAYAHAEGYQTTASAPASHAEGNGSIAKGEWGTHAEGQSTEASGYYSHAEGSQTKATGNYSHAGGFGSTASGSWAFVHGNNLIGKSDQAVFGSGNVERNEAYSLIMGDGSVSARSNCFRANTAGVYSKGVYNSSGADYAELFEWADGNPDHADRTGRFVTLDGAHIRLAGPEDDYILGVVSGAPSVVGDVYDDQWRGMGLTDIFGRPIMEDVEIPAVTETFPDPEDPENTITRVVIPAHTERRQKLNPTYDNTQPYIPRTERPEWDAVGLLGKLVAVDDGTCQANGWAKVGQGGAATASVEQTRFRVMERLDETHIRIMLL